MAMVSGDVAIRGMRSYSLAMNCCYSLAVHVDGREEGVETSLGTGVVPPGFARFDSNSRVRTSLHVTLFCKIGQYCCGSRSQDRDTGVHASCCIGLAIVTKGSGGFGKVEDGPARPGVGETLVQGPSCNSSEHPSSIFRLIRAFALYGVLRSLSGRQGEAESVMVDAIESVLMRSASKVPFNPFAGYGCCP